MRFLSFIISFIIGISFSGVAYAQYSWDWIAGGTGGSEGWAVCTDPWGNVFGLGYPYGASVQFGTVTLTGFGGNAAIVVKYDASGNLVWAHSTQNADAHPIGIAADAAGDLYLLGTYSSATLSIETATITNPTSIGNGVFLAKFSPTGSVDWLINVTILNSGFSYMLGGVAANGTDVYVTSTFNAPSITVGTYTLTNTDPSGNSADIFLTKIDGAGNIIWAKSAGGSSDDFPYSIAVTPSANIYITGNYHSPTLTFGSTTITNSAANNNIFLAKYDASGNVLWAKTAGNGNEDAYSVATDVNEDAYITGFFYNETLSFGSVSVNNTTTINDVYLAKYAAAGNAVWAKEISGTSYLRGFGVAVDPCNNVWISGSMGSQGAGTSASITIDGNNLTAPAASADPMFIAGYTGAGTYITSQALPTGGDDLNGICSDGVGNIFIGGDVAISPVTLGSTTLIDSGGENLFVAKFGLTTQKDTTNEYVSACVAEQLYAPSGYTTYLWSNGSTDSTATFDSAGTYWVKVTGGCNNPVALYSYTVTDGVGCNSCANALFVPNAFTPNGDAQDDVFYPRSGGGISLIKSFRIYNRWGQLLFERSNIMPNDASNAWDGTYQNNKQLPDVYVWVVDALCENGKTINKKGSITVIR